MQNFPVIVKIDLMCKKGYILQIASFIYLYKCQKRTYPGKNSMNIWPFSNLTIEHVSKK